MKTKYIFTVIICFLFIGTFIAESQNLISNELYEGTSVSNWSKVEAPFSTSEPGGFDSFSTPGTLLADPSNEWSNNNNNPNKNQTQGDAPLKDGMIGILLLMLVYSSYMTFVIRRKQKRFA